MAAEIAWEAGDSDQACGSPYGLCPASMSHQRARGKLHITAQKHRSGTDRGSYTMTDPTS